jgi:predicted permease
MLSLSEIRLAVRSLRKSPAFTVTAVVALGIGLGANAAIFSLVDAMLIRPLPLQQPDRLVLVWEDASRIGFARNTPAPGNFADWKARNHVFTGMAALRGEIYSITGDGQPEQVQGSPVSANLFKLLGVAPEIGRNIAPDEDRPGAAPVLLISHRLWQQRYGGDPAIAGRQILLDGIACRIIGVMPPGFQFPEHSDVWPQLALSPEALIQRSNHYLRVYARMRPGVTIEDAQRDMTAIAAQLEREHPDTNAHVGAVVIALRDQVLGKLDLALRVLAAGVGCVLLICCANIAGLMLARAAGREREMAVRAALGAGRWRLVRQGLTESLLIACAGTLLGLLMAANTVPWLSYLVPQSIAGWTQPRLDLRLLVFASILSIAAAVLFGSLPALALTRVDLAGALQKGGRAGIGGAGALRRALVAGEVALTVVLSVGAALMVQTVWRLAHIELGFHPEGVLTVRTSLPSRRPPYREFAARHNFYQQVIAKVEAIPGVAAAGYTTFLPLTNRGGTSGFIIEGAPPLTPGQFNDANHRAVSSAYFRAVGTPLLAGRFFNDLDRPGSAPVAIVNEAMAKQYWPNQNPLGHRFRLDAEGEPWITVVGVVASARQFALDMGGRAEMYFPSSQEPGSEGYFAPRDLAVKVSGKPLDYAAAVRRAIWSVDPNQAIADVQPLDSLVKKELVAQKAQLWLLASFAGLALLLAAIGLYGLLSHVVLQRTRDIGLRMALGARQTQVLGKVMSEGLRLVAIGLAIGMAGAAALTRVMQSLLFGVGSGDAPTYLLVALILCAVAAIACYVPARRATRIDPMVALRME